MKSGSSASITAAGQDFACVATASWYQQSRGGYIGTGVPVRRTTSTCVTHSVPSMLSAPSTLCLSGTRLPPRSPSSAVMTMLEPQSAIRPPSASDEKPANTTECTAPIRAHASIAMAISGIIGRYIVTRSPLPTPSDVKPFAHCQVAVQTIARDIEFSVVEPTDMTILVCEARVFDP